MQCSCMVLKKCTHAKEEECLQVKVWTNLIVNATIQVLCLPLLAVKITQSLYVFAIDCVL